MTIEISRKPRIVLKFSSQFFKPLDARFLIELAQTIEGLRATYNVAIVSSGAIAMARGLPEFAQLQKTGAPLSESDQQMMASVGQPLLVESWREAFMGAKVYGGLDRPSSKVAQILLTHEDLADEERCQTIQGQFDAHFRHGIIPLLNENDAVAKEEITFGDNDHLAAMVARTIGADTLVLCTRRVAGFLGKDKRLVPEIAGIPEDIYTLAAGSDDPRSRGGMRSKLLAAMTAAEHEGEGTPVGCTVILGDGNICSKLTHLFGCEGLSECTRIYFGALCSAAQEDWARLSYRHKGPEVFHCLTD